LIYRARIEDSKFRYNNWREKRPNARKTSVNSRVRIVL